jgi:hypothetical protein
MRIKLNVTQPAVRSAMAGKASVSKECLKTIKMGSRIARLQTQGAAGASKPIPIKGRSLTHPIEPKASFSIQVDVSGSIGVPYLGTSSTQFSMQL